MVLVMKYVDGNNLDALLFSKEDNRQVILKTVSAALPISPDCIQVSEIEIACKIANAIDYMHTHSPIIVHQDIKPQNVLVSRAINNMSLYQ